MVDIQSKEVIDKISDELKIQPALQIPRGLSKDIQLTYEVNPQKNISVAADAAKLATGTEVLMTTPTDRDFYLTTAILSGQADVLCDNVSISLNAQLKGKVSNEILRLAKISLTVFSGQIAITFPQPMLLDRGTTILIASTFSAGACSFAGTITGYVTDPQ